jgi:hypothetical protein
MRKSTKEKGCWDVTPSKAPLGREQARQEDTTDSKRKKSDLLNLPDLASISLYEPFKDLPRSANHLKMCHRSTFALPVMHPPRVRVVKSLTKLQGTPSDKECTAGA